MADLNKRPPGISSKTTKKENWKKKLFDYFLLDTLLIESLIRVIRVLSII